MNKTDLIDVVAKNADLKKKDAEAAVNCIINTITTTLASGEKVQIAGIGTFDVKNQPAREGRNPKTQAVISIPASKRPFFTASKTLKENVNK